MISVFDVNWIAATLGVIAGTLTEALCPWLNDNLTAPFAIAAVVWSTLEFLLWLG